MSDDFTRTGTPAYTHEQQLTGTLSLHTKDKQTVRVRVWNATQTVRPRDSTVLHTGSSSIDQSQTSTTSLSP